MGSGGVGEAGRVRDPGFGSNAVKVRLNQVFLLLATCALCAPAYADYGQMRIDGLALLLTFVLTIACGVAVDLALIARAFRYRAALVVGFVISLVVVFLFVGSLASQSERAGFFKGAPGGASLVVLVLTSAVFVPFILVAPFAQYGMRHENGRWPRWITAWLVLQVALLPALFVLANTEEHFWQQEYEAGLAASREVRAGGLGALLERAEQRRERIWGTGLPYPGWQEAPSGYRARPSAWMAGLSKGVDDSTLIAADEPLSEQDRGALQTLVERHFVGYAITGIETKLLWDALEPGNFSRLLAPFGPTEQGVVSAELIPGLLERLEKYAEPRLCPGGQMVDADRAVLSALVLLKAGDYDAARERELQAELEAKKTELEMSEASGLSGLIFRAANALRNASAAQPVKAPDWSGYPQRVERLCRGPV